MKTQTVTLDIHFDKLRHYLQSGSWQKSATYYGLSKQNLRARVKSCLSQLVEFFDLSEGYNSNPLLYKNELLDCIEFYEGFLMEFRAKCVNFGETLNK